AIKGELKWLAGELTPARELDVLMSRAVAPVKKRRVRFAGVPSLAQELAEKRKAALTRAEDAITSPRFRALTLDVVAWLETGQWLDPPDDLVRDRGNVPIEAAAAAQLTRRWRKIRKKGKSLAQLNVRS